MGNALFGVLSNLLGRGRSNENVSITQPTSEPDEATHPAPVYSWNKHANVDAGELLIENCNGLKLSRTLAPLLCDQKLAVQNCTETLVTVASLTNCLVVDDCTRCKIVVGPVRGRNCHECLLVSSCGQLRTRDCTDLTLFLHCGTEPSIESSSRMSFSCLSLNYERFSDQLKAVGLDASVNWWWRVFDFTPPVSSSGSERNWRLLTAQERLEDFLSADELLHCFNQGLNFERTASAVPYTHPSLDRPSTADRRPATVVDISDRFFNLVPSDGDGAAAACAQ